MAERTCTIDGCERPQQARGWCPMHYKRWRRNGDPTTITRRSPTETPDTCTVPGCDKPHRARGWCQAHYRRWCLTGDVGEATLRRPTGTWTSEDRHIVHAPDHPLGRSAGGTHAARIVLFDKIGYGPHCCHWCRTPITWRAPTYTGSGAQIHTDHVNGDTLDDRPENLVQSCPPCNGKRSDPRHPKRQVCTVDDCHQRHHARGYCPMHYGRAVRAGSL
jgi:hypothetical protein